MCVPILLLGGCIGCRYDSECSDRGVCVFGVCKCNAGYSAQNCSQSTSFYCLYFSSFFFLLLQSPSPPLPSSSSSLLLLLLLVLVVVVVVCILRCRVKIGYGGRMVGIRRNNSTSSFQIVELLSNGTSQLLSSLPSSLSLQLGLSTIDPLTDTLYFIASNSSSSSFLPLLCTFSVKNSSLLSLLPLSVDFSSIEFAPSSSSTLYGIDEFGYLRSIDTSSGTVSPPSPSSIHVGSPIVGLSSYDIRQNLYFSFVFDSSSSSSSIILVTVNTSSQRLLNSSFLFPFTSSELDSMNQLLFGISSSSSSPPSTSLLSYDLLSKVFHSLLNFTAPEEERTLYWSSTLQKPSPTQTKFWNIFYSSSSQRSQLEVIDTSTLTTDSRWILTDDLLTLEFLPPVGCDGVSCECLFFIFE